MLSGILFQYPGAIIMTAVGAAAAKILANPAPWLQGITTGVSAAGVALVASAAKSLCYKVCPDTVPAILCAAAAVATIYKPAPWMFPSLIGAGGIITMITRRKQQFKVEVGGWWLRPGDRPWQQLLLGHMGPEPQATCLRMELGRTDGHGSPALPACCVLSGPCAQHRV
jgi:chromate transport protein ChrA